MFALVLMITLPMSLLVHLLLEAHLNRLLSRLLMPRVGRKTAGALIDDGARAINLELKMVSQ